MTHEGSVRTVRTISKRGAEQSPEPVEETQVITNKRDSQVSLPWILTIASWRTNCCVTTFVSVLCVAFFVMLVYAVKIALMLPDPGGQREIHFDSGGHVLSVVAPPSAADSVNEEDEEPSRLAKHPLKHPPGSQQQDASWDNMRLYKESFRLSRAVNVSVMYPSNSGLEGTLDKRAMVLGWTLICKLAGTGEEYVFPDPYEVAGKPHMRADRKRDRIDSGLYVEVTPLTEQAVDARCSLSYLVYTPPDTE